MPTSSVPWLVRTALVCKSFAEPALSVLYQAPPLSPPSRARGLLLHLQGQGDHSTYNYRSKVKYLDIEASETLFRKYKGHDPIDMGELLAVTPQIRGIGIHLRTDFPKSHRLSCAVPRAKTEGLLQATFATLQQQGSSLQEWKWNYATADWLKQENFSAMAKYHESVPFQRLTKLTIVGLPRVPTQSGSKEPEELLASAICVLPSLQELHLAISPLVNATLLPLLPHGLQVLSITKCLVDAKMLTAFLASHGKYLCRLVLDHNKSLNLSFLVDLAKTCPALESLTMDLTYHDSHFTFSDSDPQFDSLLVPGEIPTWPTSLQQLELLHLRKWDNEIAETFFSSLIDAAPQLPNLRCLNIKASLNESGWRERVSFRDRWATAFQKVFLRVSPPPNPHLSSIATFQAYKVKQASIVGVKPKIPTSKMKEDLAIHRRLSRVEIPPSHGQRREDGMTAEAVNSGFSDEPLVRKRRSTRLEQHNGASYHSNPRSSRRHHNRRQRRTKASDDESSSDDSAINDKTILDNQGRQSHQVGGSEEPYVQGMCDFVRVLIDNLRPTEEQLDESDFLDDEISGDEDWNGDDDGVLNDGYAW